jgi:hypothetical protein
MTHARSVLPHLLLPTLLACAACGNGDTSGAGGNGGEASSSSTTPTTTSTGNGTGGAGGSTTSSTTSTGTGSAANMVTFRYHPAWDGVTAVTVIGGFGQGSDWDPKQPFLTLTKDAAGTWSGSAMLPAGDYLYVYHVTGDAAAMPTTLSRYAIDPMVSAFAPCPASSPTYDKSAPNPCAQISSPQVPAETVYHVHGKVTYDGQGIGGYLVQLDRQETMSHHFFLNRSVTAADGTFDLQVTSEQVRLQVLHPTFLNKTDVERDPVTLAAMRRSISGSFPVSADVTVNPTEIAYHDYAKLTPTGAGTLPTTFKISVITGAAKAKAAVYGVANGMIKNIGDPWYDSGYGTATTVSFDGTFNTKQAMMMKVQTGTEYLWGTWQQWPTPMGGVAWSGESMVLPITWN